MAEAKALVDVQLFSKHKGGVQCTFMVTGILGRPLHNSWGEF